MNDSLKKVAVILVASVILFWIFKPKAEGEKGFFSSKSDRTPIRKPTLNEEGMSDPDVKSAYTALCAYIDAYNDGVPEDELTRIKKDFKEQIGIEIYEDGNNKLAARDNNGEDILVNS